MTPEQQKAIAIAKARARVGQTKAQAPQEDVIMQKPDGGRVIRMSSGQLAFTSPGYSTSDPAQVAKIMEGATPAETSTAGFYEQAVRERPVSSRAATAVKGVPFVGSWLDEAVSGAFGPQAGEAMRFSQKAMEETRPGQSTAMQLGTGLAASIPMVLAAAPYALGGATSLAGQAIRGGIAGAMGGAAEGGIYGAGLGEPGSRGEQAGMGALMGGGIGGVLGTAAPLLMRGGANVIQRMRSTPERAAAEVLNVSPETARLLGRVVEAEDPAQIAQRLQSAGPSAMLADIGPTASDVLDTTMQTPGASARIGQARVETRATETMGRIAQTLDNVLGAPAGIQAQQDAIRQGTAGARSSAYNAAYARPIDYSADAGRKLEGLLPRIPREAIANANRLMQLNGEQSAQIMANIADDGTVTFTRMPDVRQWDYIKQGLDQLASTGDGAGALGGQTRMGAAYERLARAVRDNLRTAVPEYGAALETAADAISRVKGVEFGAKLLNRSTTREAVRNFLDGATGPEIAAIRSGVRQQIDDVLANVRAVASDQNIDARQAREALSMLTTPAAREKLGMLLEPQAARELFAQLREAGSALGLRAEVATNSRTAGRQITREFIEDVTQPSGLTQLAQARPIEAVQAIIQSATKTTPGDISERSARIMAEVTDVLTRSGLPQAQDALRIIESMQAGQPISEAQARRIASAFTSAVGSAAYLQGTQATGARQ